MGERMYQCTKCKEYKAIQPLTECDDCIEKQHQLEEKAAKWDEFKTPKGVVLGETEGCYPYGDSGYCEVTTALNCPMCIRIVGQENNEGEIDIWFKHCPECGQSIEQLSDEELERIYKLFEEREQCE